MNAEDQKPKQVLEPKPVPRGKEGPEATEPTDTATNLKSPPVLALTGDTTHRGIRELNSPLSE
jgi:hypothetical protein